MTDAQQPSFEPNEFIHRWLSHMQPPGNRQADRYRDEPNLPPALKHAERSEAVRDGEIAEWRTDGEPYMGNKPNTQLEPRGLSPRTQETSKVALHCRSNHTKPRETGHGCRKTKRLRSTTSHSDHSSQRLFETDRLISKKIRSPSITSKTSDTTQPSDFPIKSAAATSDNVMRKKYERRPRHKTRPDKYELKIDKKIRKGPGVEKTQPKSRRKRRKKTGLALNIDFKAPSVPQERLTLKPNSGPGLFRKDKASAPVERRGLPDLTFSEMAFLRRRPSTDNTQHQALKRMQPPQEKSSKGSAQETSEFFARPEQQDPIEHSVVGRASNRHKAFPNSSISSARPSPARKLLCMISDNGLMPWEYSNHSAAGNDLTKRWVPDPAIPVFHHFEHIHKPSLGGTRLSPTTSCYSWCVTPSKRGSLLATAQIPPGKHPNAAVHPVYESPRKSLRRGRIGHNGGEGPDQSSISDRSLDHYTKHILLGKGSECHWSHMPPHVSGRDRYYTLGDLKGMARLSELDTASGDPDKGNHQQLRAKNLGRHHQPSPNLATHGVTQPGYSSSVHGLVDDATRTPSHHNETLSFGNRRTDLPGRDSSASNRGITQTQCQAPKGLSAMRSITSSIPKDSLPFRYTTLTGDGISRLLRTNTSTSEDYTQNDFPVDFARTSCLHHPSRPLWQNARPKHELARYPKFAEEMAWSTGAHLLNPIHNSSPGRGLNTAKGIPMARFEESYAEHDRLSAEAYEGDQNLMNSDGHDDFDKTLLHEAGHLNMPLNALDESRIEQRERPWGGQQKTRSRHGQPFARSPWHITGTLEHDTSGIPNDKMQLQEVLGAERLTGNANGGDECLVHASRPGFGYGEEQEQFTGFARRHILY